MRLRVVKLKAESCQTKKVEPEPSSVFHKAHIYPITLEILSYRCPMDGWPIFKTSKSGTVLVEVKEMPIYVQLPLSVMVPGLPSRYLWNSWSSSERGVKTIA